MGARIFVLLFALCLIAISDSVATQCIRQISHDDVVLHSGVKIPLARIQHHLHNVQLDHHNIARLVYIYDTSLQTLTSCVENLNITVSDALTHSRTLDQQQPIPLIVNDVQREPVRSSDLRFDHAGSVSFLHENNSNRLIAILAPRFHLTRVLEWGPYVVLIDGTHRTEDDDEDINNGSLNLVSHMLQEIDNPGSIDTALVSRQQSPWIKCFPRKMEIEVMWDQSFCAQYENNASYAAFQVMGTVAGIVPMFETRTCVSITVIKFYGYCKEGKRPTDPLERMPSLDDCNQGCSRPTIILQAVRNLWWGRNVTSNVPDAVLFLSGYDDGTSVVGAAWVGGICTSYRFAWAEKLRLQVIAHEIGHLLGAGHGRYGLMRGVIDTTKTAQISKPSAIEIWDFIKSLKRGWCLSRDGKPNNQRTAFDDIPITRSGDLEPESVYVFDSRRFVGIKFLMLIRNKTDPYAPLSYIRYERQSLSGNHVTNKTRGWNDTNIIYGPNDIPKDRVWPLESAAITMSRYNLPVILTVRKNGLKTKALYVIARGTREMTTPKGWLPPRTVPITFTNGAVQSCSICRDGKDFVFLFAKQTSPGQVSLFYIIGKTISWKGIPQVWTELKKVPITIDGTVTAINVNALDIFKDDMTDLVISYIVEDSSGTVQMKIIVGFAISNDGEAEGGWSEIVDFEPTFDKKRTSIGHAVLVASRGFYNSDTGKKGVLNLPTVGFIDTVKERDSYRLVLQHEALSDGMFHEAAVVENGEAIPACEECYTQVKSESCVSLRLECSEANANLPVLESGVLARKKAGVNVPFLTKKTEQLNLRSLKQVDNNGNASDVGYPDKVGEKPLFCAGVFKLFVVKTGGSCAGKVSDAWIVTAGLAQIAQESLEDEFDVGQTNGTWSESDFTVVFSVNGTSSDDSLNGAFADVKKKGPSQIQVLSKKWLRQAAINRVVRNYLNAADYSTWFGGGTRPSIDRRRINKNGYKFVLILSLPFGSNLFR